MIEKIALISNFNIKEKADAAFLVADRIAPFCSQMLVSSVYKERILRMHRHRKEFIYMTPDEIYSSADMVIVLGGDGSMLEASRRASLAGVPILGINLGRIGYMTELELDELELVDKIFSGEYTVDERAMLSVEILTREGQRKTSSHALNEAVIANGTASRIVDLQLSDNGVAVSDFRADGLVIATPTGSTAYSLSAGGPIVDPKLSCLCVTPICPHSLLARPLVFPDTARLEVKNICVREKLLHLTLDGRVTFDLYYGDTAVITKSTLTTKLIRLKDWDFYSKIRTKKFL
ncbi:MAG: NAD(+)/NADH kinase [Ruminococcaceae bacterium]|nr:NAD(+)/NADH kinase [Oscillospiraceae bacterium]